MYGSSPKTSNNAAKVSARSIEQVLFVVLIIMKLSCSRLVLRNSNTPSPVILGAQVKRDPGFFFFHSCSLSLSLSPCLSLHLSLTPISLSLCVYLSRCLSNSPLPLALSPFSAYLCSLSLSLSLCVFLCLFFSLPTQESHGKGGDHLNKNWTGSQNS